VRGVAVGVLGDIGGGPRAAEPDGADAAGLEAVVAELARAPDNGGADVHAVVPSNSPARSAATLARTRRGNSNVWAMDETAGTAQ
jgi:hypothetical protein